MSSPITKYILKRKRNITKEVDEESYIVNSYEETQNYGCILQTKQPITKRSVERLEKTLELDWIFNIENQFIRRIEIGGYVACEIVPEWEEAIQTIQDNVFLYTGKKEWIWLVERTTYTLEIDSKRRKMWIGEVCSFIDILANTCLKYTLSKKGREYFKSLEQTSISIETIPIAYARCEASMVFLDTIHRNYVNAHVFKPNTVTAIQSVAGSGKTTTLLNLAKIHATKRILYIAFNKSLITEIKDKIKIQGIKNLYPYTFDALLYQLYTQVKKRDPNIVQLQPRMMESFLPWLAGKPYNVKKDIIRKYNNFCNNADFLDMNDYCIQVLGKKKPLLEQLWEKTTNGEFHTFENLRKLALIEHWFTPYIDKTYDMIMIDETQDFDMSMLRMLLNDTKIPKLFVGDPKQSIYEFRGCINAFLYLPKDALKIEFYSTFRVGNPACQIIRKQFSNCWMISKSKHQTILEPFSSWKPEVPTPYTYLFRSWRILLTSASQMKQVWINNFEKKIDEIRNLHGRLSKMFSVDDEFEDDLPKFLKSITSNELENLIDSIEQNLVSKDDAMVKMFTVHSYKGLEDGIVRLSDDIEPDEDTIYYVALTRGYTRILTPRDLEYFEKLIQGHDSASLCDNKEPTEKAEKAKKASKKRSPKATEPSMTIRDACSCNGCKCDNPTIFYFDTTAGKKKWCINCQRYECSCL